MELIKEKVFLIFMSPYRSSDLVVTFLSEERGRIQAIINGAKKQGTQNTFHYQAGDFLEIEYGLVPNRELVRIQSVHPIKQGNYERFSYKRFLFHSYQQEVIHKLIHIDDPAPVLFRLLLEYLFLDKVEEKELNRFIAWSLGKILVHCGVMPNYHQCSFCGKSTWKKNTRAEEGLFRRGHYQLIKEKGEILCQNCTKYTDNRDFLSPSMIKMLWLIENKISIEEFPLKIPAHTLEGFIRNINSFLITQIEITPKSLPLFLSSIVNASEKKIK